MDLNSIKKLNLETYFFQMVLYKILSVNENIDLFF
jgi:hypothetical protein